MKSPAAAVVAKFADRYAAIRIRQDVPWSDVTTLGVGAAPIPWLVEPADDGALAELLAECAAQHCPILLLGAGSNLVGRDTPCPEIAIRLGKGLAKIACADGMVTVGAGARLVDVLRAAAEAGLGGIAPLAAIPGSVGGALRMNAGADGVTIGGVVQSVVGRRLDGTPWRAAGGDIDWRPRASSVPADVLIVGAVLTMQAVDPASEMALINECIARRCKQDPRGRSAGCAFRNPSPAVPAGRLLDQAGAKGLRAGDAALSERHANWLMNVGNATEEDVVELLRQVRRRVVERAGIYLFPEVAFADPAAARRVIATPAPLHVAVLKGGASSERAVSLESGAAVAAALRAAGYEVDEIDLQALDLPAGVHRADVAFPVLHGGFGENGDLQAALTAQDLPFVGCDEAACRIVFDKIPSKEAMVRASVPTPAYGVLAIDENDLPPGMALPVVVKPPAEGSTVGISLVFSPEEWRPALALARQCEPGRVLVEQYIAGREITVGVLGDQALPLVEIQYPGKMYDYDAKYTHALGETQYHCPPVTIPPDVQVRAQAVALAFARAVGARDMVRVDMIVRDGDDALFVLEGNNIPGFTASSLLPKAARAAGLEFPELCGRLVQMAWHRALVAGRLQQPEPTGRRRIREKADKPAAPRRSA
jgi:UDP-N-acetylenolpyruvoylglucosamine reductase